jgi:hypothetical protein
MFRTPDRYVDVGEAGILSAVASLRAGGRIGIMGAIGDLRFESLSGELVREYGLDCVGVDERGEPVEVSAGLVYDATRAVVSGHLRCP